MFSEQEMTVIPVSWIRILLMPPKISICDQILPRLLPARLKDCPWEKWILKAHRGSDPETLTWDATKPNREQPVISPARLLHLPAYFMGE